MSENKRYKIAFLPMLVQGCVNFSASIAIALLDNCPNVDVYMIVDEKFQKKLQDIDNRFNYGIINYENKENQMDDRVRDIIIKLENSQDKSLVNMLAELWENLLSDGEEVSRVDEISELQLDKIKPDLVLCDQVYYLPSMTKYPSAFLCSCNPLAIDLEGYPHVGDNAGVDEVEKIAKFAKEFAPRRAKIIKQLQNIFSLRNKKLPDEQIDRPISNKHFTIYAYPEECDYYSEEVRNKFRLWQIDSTLLPQRVPPPYNFPKDFDALPGRLIYVSLGSLFSICYLKIQAMIDILDKLPNAKFIVSKGPNGDKLKFPNNKFIGANFLPQTAILPKVELAIVHGGNNTFTECMYFGVKQLIGACEFDQINNQKRVEETQLGYAFDLNNYTADQLLSTVEKALNDKVLEKKLNLISKRIQKDDKLNKVAARIMNHVEKL